jgi:hypothetical protein
MTISSKSTISLPDRQLQRLWSRTTVRLNANDANDLSDANGPSDLSDPSGEATQRRTVTHPKRKPLLQCLKLRPIPQMQRIPMKIRNPADPGDLLK